MCPTRVLTCSVHYCTNYSVLTYSSFISKKVIELLQKLQNFKTWMFLSMKYQTVGFQILKCFFSKAYCACLLS